MKNQDVNDLISIDQLLKKLKKEGISLGKGDPYNRLRYYTKLNWIPNMQRKSVGKKIVGHYPMYTLELIKKIQELKELNYSNDEISAQLAKKEDLINLKNILGSQNLRVNLGIIVLVIILILQIYTYRQNEYTLNTSVQPNLQQLPTILESGSFYVPKNRSEVHISTRNGTVNSKIYVNFTQNYQPATKYWVEKDVDNNGFTLKLDSPVVKESSFDWWLSN